MNTRAFFLSALIAGLVMGLLGSLPLLNLVNCLLCIWVWLGGIFAVYLYRRYQPAGPALTPAQGAGLGAAAGLIGAVVGMLTNLITSPLTTSLMNSLARAMQVEGDLPFDTGSVIIQSLVFFAIDLVLYPLFGAVAGLLGVSLLYKKPPAVV